MKRSLTTLLICLLCSSIAEGADDWPMFQHDPQHSGYSSSPMPESLEKVWTNEGSSIVDGLGLNFAISEKKLFVSQYMSLSALDISTGSVMRSYEGVMPGLSSPAVENNRVYLNTNDEIICLDAGTGEVLWRHIEILLDFLSFPIVVDEHLIVGGGHTHHPAGIGPESIEAFERALKLAYRVMCLNRETGEIVWEFYAHDWTVYSPAYFDGKIYVNDGSKYVYCLDAQTGEPIWEKELEWTSYSSLSLDTKRIFVGTYNGVICLELETGKILWKFDCNNRVHKTPSVAYNKVFVPVDRMLYCLDAQNGELIWEIEAESLISSPTSPIIVADRKVAFGTGDGILYIVEAQSGRICESLHIDNSPIVALALSDGKLIVGQENGRISCFEGSNHTNITPLIFVLISAIIALLVAILTWYRRKI